MEEINKAIFGKKVHGAERGQYLIRAMSRAMTRFRLEDEQAVYKFARDVAALYLSIQVDIKRQTLLVETGGKDIKDAHWLLAVLECDLAIADNIADKLEDYALEKFGEKLYKSVCGLFDEADDAANSKFNEWKDKTKIVPASEFKSSKG